MTNPLRPFFSYYGSAWTKTKNLPQPVHDTIVEYFAGALGYSCHYHTRRVIACDKDENVIGVWRYLQRSTPEEILALPDVPDGGTVDDLDVCQEARWLVGFTVAHSASAPKLAKTSWARARGHGTAFWPHCKPRIASQLPAIRHWEIHHCSYEDLPFDGVATHFYDPPFQGGNRGRHYRHGTKGIDFAHLAEHVHSRKGQVIAIEHDGATWLPFENC